MKTRKIEVPTFRLGKMKPVEDLPRRGPGKPKKPPTATIAFRVDAEDLRKAKKRYADAEGHNNGLNNAFRKWIKKVGS